jgi:hypothetical protein
MPPDSIKLKTERQKVVLAAGETKAVSFPLEKVSVQASNNYPFDFTFSSDAGNAEYNEIMNVMVAPKGTKKIDGDLADWKDVPGITLVAAKENIDPDIKAKRPWKDWQDKKPDGSFGEFKMAWDGNYVYLAAKVNDPKPQFTKMRMETRNDDWFFHDASSDKMKKYQKIIKDYEGFSFAEVPYVYRFSPNTAKAALYQGDLLQVGFNVMSTWHDLEKVRTTDFLPERFHAIPDTDYEYCFYAVETDKKKGKLPSECWTMLTPRTPRIHDFPRQPKQPSTTRPTEGVQKVVRQDGNVRIYELAIPVNNMPEFKAKTGEEFGFVFRLRNDSGPDMVYGKDKAVCKTNVLALHQYWHSSPSPSIQWKLIE